MDETWIDLSQLTQSMGQRPEKRSEVASVWNLFQLYVTMQTEKGLVSKLEKVGAHL